MSFIKLADDKFICIVAWNHNTRELQTAVNQSSNDNRKSIEMNNYMNLSLSLVKVEI